MRVPTKQLQQTTTTTTTTCSVPPSCTFVRPLHGHTPPKRGDSGSHRDPTNDTHILGQRLNDFVKDPSPESPIQNHGRNGPPPEQNHSLSLLSFRIRMFPWEPIASDLTWTWPVSRGAFEPASRPKPNLVAAQFRARVQIIYYIRPRELPSTEVLRHPFKQPRHHTVLFPCLVAGLLLRPRTRILAAPVSKSQCPVLTSANQTA